MAPAGDRARNLVIAGLALATACVVASIITTRPAKADSIITCDVRGCSDWRHDMSARRHPHVPARAIDANGNIATVIIGSRPAGCPHRYCGCALARHLGLADRRLNLAWNWARLFPRVTARAGAAAVRRGHVMLLERNIGDGRWLVRDYNSGGGLSRLHVRSVRGFVFVDPSQRVVSN